MGCGSLDAGTIRGAGSKTEDRCEITRRGEESPQAQRCTLAVRNNTAATAGTQGMYRACVGKFVR